MTVQPYHQRIDAPRAIRDGIRENAPGLEVVLGVDATYRPESTVTIVQVPTMRALGDLPGQRWAFSVTVALVTVGPSASVAMDAHWDAADALLSLTRVGDIAISSVRCESEPVAMGPHTPSGADQVSSTYSLILRRIHNG